MDFSANMNLKPGFGADALFTSLESKQGSTMPASLKKHLSIVEAGPQEYCCLQESCISGKWGSMPIHLGLLNPSLMQLS